MSPDSRGGEIDYTTWGEEWLMCTGTGGIIRKPSTWTHTALTASYVLHWLVLTITLSNNYSYCHSVVTDPTLLVSNCLIPNPSQGFPQTKYPFANLNMTRTPALVRELWVWVWLCYLLFLAFSQEHLICELGIIESCLTGSGNITYKPNTPLKEPGY